MRFKIIIFLIGLLNLANAQTMQCAPDYISLLLESAAPHYRIAVPLPQSQSVSNIIKLHKQAPTLSLDAVYTAYTAYIHARALGYDRQQLLTVVDYLKASGEPRLWVFDLKHNKLLYKTLVSHGKRSGDQYARHFSNIIDSKTSSIGVMLTGKPYIGQYGYSLELYGLEEGFNDKVYERRIVMHPADYVSHGVAKKFQRVGQSFGCLAVSQDISEKLINRIKDGTIIVNYFPDPQWLKKSMFLN